jgi:hypothetical protein
MSRAERKKANLELIETLAREALAIAITHRAGSALVILSAVNDWYEIKYKEDPSRKVTYEKAVERAGRLLRSKEGKKLAWEAKQQKAENEPQGDSTQESNSSTQ